MSANRAIVYQAPGSVTVESVPYPTLESEELATRLGTSRDAPHAAILKVVATNICGSDLHLYRGRTTAEAGQTLGHEVTGEVVQVGPDVLFVKPGDICSVPFNVACGRCRNCNEGLTNLCLNVNAAGPGGGYGYVGTGGWQGGQAEYMMVPFADFNLLRFPDRDQALEKMLDLAMVSDIFATGYHASYTAGVTTGSTVYVAGAGPVGLSAAYSAQLLGASVVIVGDMISERLDLARRFGCETVNLTQVADLGDAIAQLLGEPVVDAAVDAVGFEARSHGVGSGEAPAAVLNDVMTVTRVGAGVGIVGPYVTDDEGGVDDDAKAGQLRLRLGIGWGKANRFFMGGCPVKAYNRKLTNLILSGKAHIADAINARAISLDDAPRAYEDFSRGAAVKYVIDPHRSFSS